MKAHRCKQHLRTPAPFRNAARVACIALAVCFTMMADKFSAQAVDESALKEAERRADCAHEVFSRCRRLVRAWYDYRGEGNHLLPRNHNDRRWNAQDSAADLWSFFVITDYLAGDEELHALTRQTLRDEIRLTTRIGSMTDDFLLDKGRFARGSSDALGGHTILPAELIFGASEYVKDGLLPMSESMGRTVYFERARGLLIDIMTRAPFETRVGPIPAESAEVCGEMLQGLCRMYCATGDPRFKRWAQSVGEAWLFEVMPNNNGLPCHLWSFSEGKPHSDLLSLSDHGNEIVFGLSELLMLEHVHDAEKFAEYLPPMQRMIDTLLEHAVNEHGLWHHSIKPTTLEVLNAGTPDTWGYALNAVYVMHLVTGEAKYREAVERAMRGIRADERYLNWGGADAFADAIEGGIVLYNRLRVPETLEWIEEITPTFLAKQRDDGIVEGWHGDGNYARTALMYALMQTQGVYAKPWREDLRFGAVTVGDDLLIRVHSDQPWKGRLHLDVPRHRMNLGLQVNYPRLNEFPEWYTVEPTHLYQVHMDDRALPRGFLGDDLAQGFAVKTDGGKPTWVRISPVGGPPYGREPVFAMVPAVYGGDGELRVPINLQNQSSEPVTVRLNATFGRLERKRLRLQSREHSQVNLIADVTTNTESVIEIWVEDSDTPQTETVQLVYEPGLTGLVTFDDQTYKGTGYQWCGAGPFKFSLPAKKGKNHTLRLLWGAKNDMRSARVTINRESRDVSHGGYDGFEWIELEVPAETVTEDSIDVVIESLPGETSGQAFVAEARLGTK